MSYEDSEHDFDDWFEVDALTGCWNWKRSLRNGYGTVRVDGRNVYAHRWSWSRASGQRIPSGMCICHRCDNKRCVNPEHLFLGTHKDNMRDMFAKSRRKAARGEKVGRAKLKEADVAIIKWCLEAGVRLRTLGRLYRVRHTTIRNIGLGLAWSHVPPIRYEAA